jgi:hypothetical protein
MQKYPFFWYSEFDIESNGNCDGQIKGNKGSNGWVFHVPGGLYYDKTKAGQCFTTEESAKGAV